MALKDKIDSIEHNLSLAKSCKESEERYVNLLLKLQEVHERARDKSQTVRELMVENQNLKDEIAMLQRLVING